MSQETKQLYEFGRFTLDVDEGRLLRDGHPIPLKPKVLETLLVLVENTGHVMDKEGLMKRLWPDSFVEEANLAVNISQLRKALGDDENGEGFIETVPKRGYRFAAQVTKVLADRTDLVVHERTRSRIVIEEHETGSDDGAQPAIDVGLATRAVAALPAAPLKFLFWKRQRVQVVRLAGVLVLATVGYFIYASRSISGGFFRYPYIKDDPLLSNLRQEGEYALLLSSARKSHEEFKGRFF